MLSNNSKKDSVFVMAGQKRVFALDVPAIYALLAATLLRRGCPRA
jgi:hypothetical protein